MLGKKCLGNREQYLDYWKNYAPHVRRPRSVQEAAKAFFEEMFHSRQYAGIHWRYDTYDWNDMCKESRPDAAKLRFFRIFYPESIKYFILEMAYCVNIQKNWKVEIRKSWI